MHSVRTTTVRSASFAVRTTAPWVSDEFTVPLCRVHHRELHRQGDEPAWWVKLSIDPNCAQALAANARARLTEASVREKERAELITRARQGAGGELVTAIVYQDE